MGVIDCTVTQGGQFLLPCGQDAHAVTTFGMIQHHRDSAFLWAVDCQPFYHDMFVMIVTLTVRSTTDS